MSMGIFHQSLIGNIKGWHSYQTGHTTGCDIGTIDGTRVGEVKNNINTMNSDSHKSVIKKLKKVKKDKPETELFLIQINSNKPIKIKNNIKYISGKDFYKDITGQECFFENLLNVINYIFTHYKTYKKLKKQHNRKNV
jgi:hypothetical protein